METEKGPKVEKQPLIPRIVASDKFAKWLAKNLVEGFTALTILTFEHLRFMRSRPIEHDLRPELVSPPTGPVEIWTYRHIGDVFEVAWFFTATRLALAGFNEAFKRVTKKEIPNEACFWASMATSVTIPSLMELNIIPLFGEKLNSTSDPADLFGVGVGALVIIASQYASKYRELIKRVASLGAARIAEGARPVVKKLEEFYNYAPEVSRPDDKV